MLMCSVAFTVMYTLIKELENFHFTQVVFVRSIIPTLMCVVLIRRKGILFSGNNPMILIIRTIFGLITMTLFFITLQRMSFGVSVTLKYLAPLFAALFAVWFLNEKVKPIQWLLIIIALMGVLLLKGFDTNIDSLNLTLGLIGALFGGLAYVTIRKIGGSEDSLVIVFYFMGTATVLAGLAMIPYWYAPSGIEVLIASGIGISGYYGQLYMTKAFQFEDTSRVAPIRYMEVVNAVILGWVLFGEKLSIVAIGAIFLIVGAMLLNIRMNRM